MPITVPVTIADADAKVLNQLYKGDIAQWLQRVITSEAEEFRAKALQNRLQKVKDKPAFRADLAVLIDQHDTPT